MDISRFRPIRYSTEAYLKGITEQNPTILSKAITLIESQLERDKSQARELLDACLPLSGRSVRIGITGSPGVGKSTFIEAFGGHLLEQGKKLAVLAVDPSSPLGKGSILGDKTRMQTLINHPNVFVRPSPSGQALGGVAHKTREAITLCEAAGFELILVETVGVGQSEYAVKSMTDCFLFLVLPNAGDELQGIKRGIMEMADIIVINKADTGREAAARLAQAQYRNALHLYPLGASGWACPVLCASALEKKGISEVWEQILKYKNQLAPQDFFVDLRASQNLHWFEQHTKYLLETRFFAQTGLHETYQQLKTQIQTHQISPFVAAELLINNFYKNV